MTFIMRFLENEKKRQPSPSMYNETGFYNWFGGFYYYTDRRAYFGLLWLMLERPLNPAYRKLGRRFIWQRWIHRSCDTTDFHHSIYCMLDPWVRKREAEDRYVEVWKGYFETKENDGSKRD